MAHTKQTPRNPNLERPTSAMGSGCPTIEKHTFEANNKESSYKRRKTTTKIFIT